MSAIATQAARQAKVVLSQHDISTIPVPIDRIARKMGIVVQNIPLDDELSGMSFIKNGVSVIVVNAAHHPNRQRFTLAHELGHHVMHSEYLLNNVHVDKAVLHRNARSSGGSDQKEVEANSFAAEILMPTSSVQKFKDMDVNDETELSSLARRFKVSVSAMAFRIMNIS